MKKKAGHFEKGGKFKFENKIKKIVSTGSPAAPEQKPTPQEQGDHTLRTPKPHLLTMLFVFYLQVKYIAWYDSDL